MRAVYPNTIEGINSSSSNPPDSSTYLLRLESIKLASEILYKSNDLDEIIPMADKIFNYLKS